MLLGQNVNSYRDETYSSVYGLPTQDSGAHLAPGFRTIYKQKEGGRRFIELLDIVSRIDPNVRIRFTSPHPKGKIERDEGVVNNDRDIFRLNKIVSCRLSTGSTFIDC